MIEKVVIKNNEDSPIHYLSDLKAFKNGTEYVFKEGVNVIVGKNGCGKTTLLRLIEKYLLVDKTECSWGEFNCNILDLHKDIIKKGLYEGVEVYADYHRNTFRLCHKGERNNEELQESAEVLSEFLVQKESSTGESVLVSLNSMFRSMFGKGARLTFDYLEKTHAEVFPEYMEYIGKHRIDGNEWTLLMDEPDRNLDIEKIGSIKEILSFHKPQTQVIAVVHNPLLIVALSRNPEVNIIEMTKGYVKQVTKLVNELVKK